MVQGNTKSEQPLQEFEWYVPDPGFQQWAREGLAYQAPPEVSHAQEMQLEGFYIPDASVQDWAKDLIFQLAEDQAREERDRSEDADIELEPHIYADRGPERGLELGR